MRCRRSCYVPIAMTIVASTHAVCVLYVYVFSPIFRYRLCNHRYPHMLAGEFTSRCMAIALQQCYLGRASCINQPEIGRAMADSLYRVRKAEMSVRWNVISHKQSRTRSRAETVQRRQHNRCFLSFNGDKEALPE